MSTLESLNLGVVGAARRGGNLFRAREALDSVRVHAVCDTDPDGLYLAKTDLGADEAYHDYEEMLDRSELDAVVIGHADASARPSGNRRPGAPHPRPE